MRLCWLSHAHRKHCSFTRSLPNAESLAAMVNHLNLPPSWNVCSNKAEETYLHPCTESEGQEVASNESRKQGFNYVLVWDTS